MKKETNSLLVEFKEFISKGNVLDLAFGVVIGGAFGKIVSSLVNDIVMPLVGIILGGIDFSGIVLRIGESTIRFGSFIQSVVDFLVVAACIFAFIKLIEKAKKKKQEEKSAEPVKSEEVQLLEDIRDLLKKKKSK